MTATEWTWLIVGAVGVLVIGGLILWGLAYLAREQRRIKTQRRPEYHSPRSAAETGIRWGDETNVPAMLSEPHRIQWGTEQEQDWEWGTVAPTNSTESTDSNAIKCPICKHVINETSEHSFKCPGCGSLYHIDCWEFIERKCSMCSKKSA